MDKKDINDIWPRAYYEPVNGVIDESVLVDFNETAWTNWISRRLGETETGELSFNVL